MLELTGSLEALSRGALPSVRLAGVFMGARVDVRAEFDLADLARAFESLFAALMRRVHVHGGKHAESAGPGPGATAGGAGGYS